MTPEQEMNGIQIDMDRDGHAIVNYKLWDWMRARIKEQETRVKELEEDRDSQRRLFIEADDRAVYWNRQHDLVCEEKQQADAKAAAMQQWAEEAQGIIAALLEGGKIWTLGTTRDVTKSPRWQEAQAFLARPLPEEEPTP